MNLKHVTYSHFTESLGGGVLTSIRAITEAQKKIGFNTEIVYLERSDTPPPEQIKALFPNSRIVNLGTSNSLGKIRFLIYSSKLLLKLKSTQIIHVHSTIAGVLVRIPNLLFRRSIYYTPHCYSFVRQDIGLYRKFFFRFVETTLSSFTPTIVLGCSYSETEFGRKLGAKSSRYLGNYVDVPKIRNTSQTPNLNSRVVIGTVGRVTKQKNLPRYIDLLQNVDLPFTFNWIGGDEKTTIEIGEGKCINFSGWLSPEKVKIELQKLDIFLLLSDWEGLPFVVLEAMALGKPVILWNFDSASELVPTGNEGYIVSSIDMAVTALSELISSPEKRREFGNAGYANVQSHFNLDMLSEKMEIIYNS